MLEAQIFDATQDCGECLDATMLALLEGPGPAIKPLSPPSDFEFPRWIWHAMAGAYCIFFAGLAIATAHSGPAVFAILVSVGYTLMYFGTARILAGVRPGEGPSDFARGVRPLSTWTGPMERSAVAAQVLVVPFCLALFGTGFAVLSVALL
jgi:hypothetical protein